MSLDEFLTIQFPAFLLCTAIIGVCVLFHFQVLLLLTTVLDKSNSIPRSRIIIGILGILAAHLVEIWIFTLGYLVLDDMVGKDLFVGDMTQGLIDIAYFSAVTFTTVGYGDISPLGPARFMAAMQSLTGLVLIAWSASFTYVEMGKFWRRKS